LDGLLRWNQAKSFAACLQVGLAVDQLLLLGNLQRIHRPNATVVGTRIDVPSLPSHSHAIAPDSKPKQHWLGGHLHRIQDAQASLIVRDHLPIAKGK
jgi:hypothetical protein